MLLVALVGLGVAWAQRSRFAVWLTSLTVLTAAAYVLDPQGSLWNERLLPFWFFGAWLTCGWVFGVGAATIAARSRQRVAERWIADVHLGSARRSWRSPHLRGWPAAVGGAMLAGVVVVVVVLPPMTTLVPRRVLSAIGITPGSNEVPNWAAYNYTGYQGVPGWSSFNKDWTEYHAIIQLMARTGAADGCGQSMWEYDPSESDFGTTESLMLLPYWTNNCIGSMEGLLFESSATTPYHFLNQSELSDLPSDPMVGLPYGPSGSPDVLLGLHHLQLLGVRYFLAFSPNVVRATERSGLATQLARIGPFHYGPDVRTWHLFLMHDAPTVAPLAALPVVVPWLASKGAWQSASVSWWLHPSRWGVYLAQSGPATWPRATRSVRVVREHVSDTTPVSGPTRARGTISHRTVVTVRYPRVQVAAHVSVTGVAVGVSSLRFHVSTLGVPVVVRVSYYPRWQATGATGPFRVSPNLMVVVPTAHEVVLTYGTTDANEVGSTLTVLGVVLALAVGILSLLRRRRRVVTPTALAPDPAH